VLARIAGGCRPRAASATYVRPSVRLPASNPRSAVVAAAAADDAAGAEF